MEDRRTMIQMLAKNHTIIEKRAVKVISLQRTILVSKSQNLSLLLGLLFTIGTVPNLQDAALLRPSVDLRRQAS